MTRACFTAMIRCRWPHPSRDGEKIGILVKAAGGGARIREVLRIPRGVLLHVAAKSSHRLAQVIEYYECVLHRSRLRDGNPSPDDAGLELRDAGRRVVYLLDWFKPHVSERIVISCMLRGPRVSGEVVT